MRNVIVILGPTASGKTAVSIELSKLIDCEIISADSRQIFRYLDIGTAKPTKDEQAGVKHHFIDFLNPDEYYSAGLFANQAEYTLTEIFNNNKIPLLVGGSGLYIKALCEGLFTEDINYKLDNVRENLIIKLNEKGIDELYNELVSVDKASAELYNDKNPRRILRALEYYYSTGIPLSIAQVEKKANKNFKTRYFGIYFDREDLYKRINLRTEIMWESGLVDETQNVLKLGYSPDLNSLNTVGYKECISYLNGVLTKEKAIELTKQNTRRYAKRQLTWFRKNSEIKWINGINSKILAELIINNEIK